jgi:FkbM family methyltransferase
VAYSQEGEDLILKRIFEGLEKGFYVDVGALDPMRYSNTYIFYERGWSGINIDAMPASMDRFKVERPRDINLEVAIAKDKGERTFFIFNEPALNSFDEELSRSRVKGFHRIIREQKIITRTLKEVLDEHLPRGRAINFMSIDVEGVDLEVLQSNDWHTYRPQYILTECFGMTMPQVQQSEVNTLLDEQGYELFAKTVNTAIFKDRVIAAPALV